MKKIILVTHGEAQRGLPDPGLTETGKKQMEELRTHLLKGFDKFDFVIVGMGKRHKEALQIIAGRRKPDMISEIVGVPDTLSSDERYMILSNGEKIPIEEYAENRFEDIRKRVLPFLKQIFNRLEENILIAGGRIAAIGTGISPEEAKSGHIYYITLTESGKIEIRD